MKKILFAAMAAIIVCGMFAGLSIIVRSNGVTNGMFMDPTQLTVDPPIGGSDLTFAYAINITTTVINVTVWEAKLLWNPAVLRAYNVTWGDFMRPGGQPEGYNVTSGGGEYIILGQDYTVNYNGTTGSGRLAYINFTFVLPGATTVVFKEAKVWDANLTEYNLLPPPSPSGIGDTTDGRVKSNRPHPAFWWATDDQIAAGTYKMNPLPGDTSGTPRVPTSGEIYDGGTIVNVPGVSTNVHFNASSSYDVSNMVWNGTAWNLSSVGLDTYVWNFGDESDPGNGLTVDHVFPGYNKDGWLVTLWVNDTGGDEWQSDWRYQGPAADNTVPMYRDVAVLDIWPTLPPYEKWDRTGHDATKDWWNSWSFDTVDFWIPNTADAYWNYNLSDSFCDQNTGYALPTPDTRLLSFGSYANGSRVKPTESDAGRNLTDIGVFARQRPVKPDGTYTNYYYWKNTGTSVFTGNTADVNASMWIDIDGDGFLSPADSIVKMTRAVTSINTTTYAAIIVTFNSTLGDQVIFGPAVTNGTTMNFFTYEGYDDANANGGWDAGESFYWDEAGAFPSASAGKVSGAANPTVKQAYDETNGWGMQGSLYGGCTGLWIIVTANNFGTVTERCTIKLYAIGSALKPGYASDPPTSTDYTPLQVTSIELIGQWSNKFIKAGAGTGFGLITCWMPPKNATYTLMATIEPQMGTDPYTGIDATTAIDDADWTNNYYVLPQPVSNIANFNKTSGALVSTSILNSAYLCDLSNPAGTGTDGKVGSPDLTYLIAMYGVNNPLNPTNQLKIPTSGP